MGWFTHHLIYTARGITTKKTDLLHSTEGLQSVEIWPFGGRESPTCFGGVNTHSKRYSESDTLRGNWLFSFFAQKQPNCDRARPGRPRLAGPASGCPGRRGNAREHMVVMSRKSHTGNN